MLIEQYIVKFIVCHHVHARLHNVATLVGDAVSTCLLQDGQTALFAASRKGHDRIVELLLRREADVNHHTKVRLLMLVCVSHRVVTLQHIVNL